MWKLFDSIISVFRVNQIKMYSCLRSAQVCRLGTSTLTTKNSSRTRTFESAFWFPEASTPLSRRITIVVHQLTSPLQCVKTDLASY